MNKPRVLLFDIETSPIVSYTWGLFDQNVGLEQVKEDWSVLAWAAKWEGESKIFYADTRKEKDVRNDKRILLQLWSLLDQADIVIGQNLDKFDVKKVNARFLIHGMQPPSPYRTIDTLKLARKRFGMTSNKLAYLSDKLCPDHKKDEHKEFPGFKLWKECLAGNKKAWAEMEAYNKQDVVSLEAVYKRLAPWGTGINRGAYTAGTNSPCSCGSKQYERRGFAYTATGKYQQLKCNGCGAWSRDPENLLTAKKRRTITRS